MAKQTKEEKERIIKTKQNEREIKKLKGSWIWKGVAIGLFIALCMSYFTNYTISQQPKNEIPYVVEVDLPTGITRVSNAVELAKYTMTEDLMMNTIKTWLTKLRTVSVDKVENNSNESYVRAFATQNALTQINSYYSNSETDPKTRGKNERVAVYIYNYMPVRTDKDLRFQLDWNEVTFNPKTNRVIKEQNYRIDVYAKQYVPTNQTKNVNALGFYVTNFTISEIENGFIKK